MTSELVTILEKEADAECERILSEARAQATQIQAEARVAAEAARETVRGHIEAERNAAQTRAQSAAQLKASSLVLKARDELLAEVFAKANEELSRIGSDRGRYHPILRALVKEAASELTGRLVVEVNPPDVETAQHAVRELGLDAEVRPAGGVRGGVRVSTTDGRFIVENTLRSRLDRVKPVLATEVAGMLWGPPGA